MSDFEGAVAVVGLGCVLPDAFSVDQFWKNTLARHCALRSLQRPPWDWSKYVDPSGRDPDRASTLLAGAVEGWRFDWRRFRMPPSDVETVNPLALMTVDAGAQALSSVLQLPAKRTGVFIGATGFGWMRDSGLRIRLPEMLESFAGALGDLPSRDRESVLAGARARLHARLGPVTEDTVVNGPSSVAAGRLAMIYDLRGLHYAIDAGFGSALAALDAGIRALRDETVDLALVGGASELLSPLELVAFSRMELLTKTAMRPFDADADGTALGEGAAMFALKRLDRALRDGETIHAVVRGVGASSDGRKPSVRVPSGEGQARAIERAYQDGRVDPRTIAYVECHATGVRSEDDIELEAHARMLPAREGVWVASGKSAVGHLRGGCGAVGLLRAVLSLQYRTLGPQVGFERPNDVLRATGMRVPGRSVELTPRNGKELRAAVHASSFGGIEYHTILESFDPAAKRSTKTYSVVSRTFEPIAIVGMGGVFPGANDVDSFWRQLLAGYDATSTVPSDRWPLERYYDRDRTRAETSYTRLGCFLDRLPDADAEGRLEVHPGLDPSHLLCLEAASQALRDAGIDPKNVPHRERTAVMMAFLPYQGRKFLADARVNVREVQTDLEAALVERGIDAERAAVLAERGAGRWKRGLPPIDAQSFVGWAGSLNSGWITRWLDLWGPHFVVDAACASSLAAMHAAVTALQHRTADMVLAGGVWCDMQPEFFVGACRFQALSDRASSPFDAAADGFVPGEGAGLFVLRRLSDALGEGQRIRAVIRAVTGSSDGKGRSVLAPTVEGEAAAMRMALEQAGWRGADVGYVECHGTGTALGDVTEAEAVARTFGAERSSPVFIGSVKSNIGHLNAAAGIPSMIKAVLAAQEGVIPASLKIESPNPKIDFQSGRIDAARTNVTWQREGDSARRAGVSSFGVGGANMHLLLEEHRPIRASTSPDGRSEVGRDDPKTPAFLIARAAGSSVAECTSHMLELARRAEREGLEVISHAVGTGTWRIAVVAPTAAEFSRRVSLLSQAVGKGTNLDFLRAQGIFVGQPTARVVAMFPGQGPHYANMGRELASAFSDFGETLEEANEIYLAITGRSLRASFWTDQPEAWKQNDEDIHCAVFAVNVALHRVLRTRGMQAICLVGQSAGELAALTVAGSLSFFEGMRAMHARTSAVLGIETRTPGRMISIRTGVERVAPLLRGLPGFAAIAADNGPSHSIVSATADAAEQLDRLLGEEGIERSVLAVSHGYHSQLIAAAMPSYRRALSALRFDAPNIPIVSTITGQRIAFDPSTYAEHLTRQFVEPVLLRQAIDEAWRAGGRVFVECGPRASLSAFVGPILEPREHVSVATIHPKVGEREQMARALACLAVHGHDRSWVEEVRVPSTQPVDPVRELLSTISDLTELGSAPARAPSRERLLETLRAIRGLIDDVLRNPESVLPPEMPSARVPSERPVARVPSERPVAPRDSVPAPTEGGEDLRARVEKTLIAAFAERTGYPEEMLEPDLELEADLGIDTVKQVAVLTKVRETLGLGPDPSFVLRAHRSIGALARHFEERVETPKKIKIQSSIPEPSRSVPAPAKADVDVLGRLIAAFAQRTGYPEEMLEPDLELEADLGIDTVKQVAVLTQLRSSLNLASDPKFVLRDHPTLRSLSTYFAARVGTIASQPEPPPSARSHEPPREEKVLERLRCAFAERTGYPEEMLEPDLELEADLGIDTVKQAAVFSKIREQLGLPSDPKFVLREHRTLASAAAYFEARLGVPAKPAGARVRSIAPPATRILEQEPPGHDAKLHVIAGRSEDTVAYSATDPARVVTEHRLLTIALEVAEPRLGSGGLEQSPLTFGRLTFEAPAAIPVDGQLAVWCRRQAQREGERIAIGSASLIHMTLDRSSSTRALPALEPEAQFWFGARGGESNAEALFRQVGRHLVMSSGWAYAPNYDVVIGEARVPASSTHARAAALVADAGWFATLLFDRTLGVLHRVQSADALIVARLPEPQRDVRFVARMAPFSRGGPRADVTFYGVDGSPLGAIWNVRGVARESSEPKTNVEWQRLVQRLTSKLLPGEDAGW